MVRGFLVLGFGALLAALLATVVWLLPGRPRTPVPEALVPKSPGAVAALDAVAKDDAAPASTKAPDAPAPQRVEVPAVEAAPEPSVQVRVVGPDGTALPGVTVRYYGAFAAAPMDAAARQEFNRLSHDHEAQLQRFGQEAVADAQGIARWPWRAVDRTSWLVGARHGDDWGEDWILANAAATVVHDLQLWPDLSCTVRVLDARQQPAAGVLLEAAYLQGADAAQTSPRPSTHSLAVTDAAGAAVVAHLQTWARSILARGAARPAMIRPRLPGVDVGQEIDTARPPPEPVVLYLPPTGAIAITVHDALGKAAIGNGIRMVEEPRPEQPRIFYASTDDQGVATYARVGLARQWRLYVQLDASSRSLERVIDGPKSAGEVVPVSIAADLAPVLCGQLLAAGKPAAGVRFQVMADGQQVAIDAAQTDGEGRFRVAASHGKWLDRPLTEVQCRGVDMRGGSDGRVASWRGQLTLSAGDHDLGALELREQPVVAAGRLQTSTGSIAPDLFIWIEAATGDAERPWQSLSLDKQLQKDGSFAFYGAASTTALRLRVDSRCDYLPVAPLPFVAGARDLLVKLERGGSVKASAVVGTYLAGWSVVPELVPMAAVAPAAGIIRFEPGSDASVPKQREFMKDDPAEIAYTWPAVAPGRYRLLLRTRGVTVPLVEVADIVVQDGECNSEARLQHLQLPGLKAITLKLPQAAALLAARREGVGMPQGAGVVFVLDGDLPTDQCVQVDGMVMLAATRPLDLLVRLHGYRDKVLRAVFEDQTVELEPGIAVALTCAGLAVPEGAKLQCTLAPVEDPLSAAHSWVYSPAAGGSLAHPVYTSPAVTSVFADGRAEFALNAPGRYRLSAQFLGADGKLQPLAIGPAEFGVGETGGSFAVQVQLPK